MSLLDRVRALQRRDLSRFRRFCIAAQPVGWVAPHIAERLRGFPKVFRVEAEAVHLADDLDSFEARSAAVDKVLRRLEEEGLVSGRRDENYPVMTRFGVPGRFAPGRWGVNTSTDGVELTFRENATA